MEHDNGAVIVGAFLAVCIITLLVAKIVESVSKFNRRTKYITYELAGACDNDEYRYWRRELRCHYLHLIPFVSRRNVGRLYNLLYHKPKHLKKEERVDILPHILAPSLVGLCLCMVCLSGISWAWFTSSTFTGAAAITTPTYTISYKVGDGDAAIISEKIVYTMTADRCTITLTANGTDGATGYCSVQIGENTYYTEQIKAVGDFTFTVNAATGTEITLTPKWGSCADTVRTEANKIVSGGNVTAIIPAPADNSLPISEYSDTDQQQEESPAQASVTPSKAETQQPETTTPITESTTADTTTPETTTPSGQTEEPITTPSTEPVTTPDIAETGSDNSTSTEQPEEATIPPETTE